MSTEDLRKQRIRRNQLFAFIKEDPDTIRTFERLITNQNLLIDIAIEQEAQIADLDARVTVLEGP